MQRERRKAHQSADSQPRGAASDQPSESVLCWSLSGRAAVIAMQRSSPPHSCSEAGEPYTQATRIGGGGGGCCCAARRCSASRPFRLFELVSLSLSLSNPCALHRSLTGGLTDRVDLTVHRRQANPLASPPPRRSVDATRRPSAPSPVSVLLSPPFSFGAPDVPFCCVRRRA